MKAILILAAATAVLTAAGGAGGSAQREPCARERAVAGAERAPRHDTAREARLAAELERVDRDAVEI